MNTPAMTAPRAALIGTLLLGLAPALAAAEQEPVPAQHEHGTMPMPGDTNEQAMQAHPQTRAADQPMKMDMGVMQGGRAPADARDPDAWADGYEYTGMPGFEQTDQLAFGKMLLDELELVSGNEGEGFGWSLQGAYGGDTDKLWWRSQGLKIGGQPVDPETGAEALWWRAYAPFWGTVLGVRQDLGVGSHSWLAAGVEGLAPYWFELQATAYVGEDGRLSARFKGSYDLLFTNRLILTPGIEANVYSRSEPERGLGSGVSNVEFGLRLRYEVRRKFAPYVGYVWGRSFAGTADLAREEGEDVSERRFVAGLRLWW
ncbi:copper resistance protein B [Pseudomonas aeruginosa]|uniref:copper resistance protein B n=1 Tax=Gammaproteobacteria TaxID=1236 RepID=UPI00192A7370|nr:MULTISPECIES: copper resistance protein B [Gammaproteobacteria]EIZ0539874.1 copper resistance protein B [Pseudomonas aeruginosa]EKV4127241.1 copper resistance protein B [Pseudomonas aeruginosa]EKW0411119.1 copper resistance protein B [Pseudomonas aeruginosa]EKW1417687.1 copper resistance protein B [Pseudomonas aeruginosa]EKW1532573.1 copper resistance protein B [Pseudomonas aeruginosa]